MGNSKSCNEREINLKSSLLKEVEEGKNRKLRNLEKQQTNQNVELTTQMKELKRQIDTIFNEELVKKLRFSKQTFYESGLKATKILARRLRTQQITKSIKED